MFDCDCAVMFRWSRTVIARVSVGWQELQHQVEPSNQKSNPPHFAHGCRCSRSSYAINDSVEEGRKILTRFHRILVADIRCGFSQNDLFKRPWLGARLPVRPIRCRTSAAGMMVDSAARCQEFVLDCDHYPEATGWLIERLKLTTR
jgi:hypothetical protein